jgi:hypothetical protein
MTKRLRTLLVLLSLFLFAAGFIAGQQTRRLKFEKYLRPTAVTMMDLSVLRANIDIIRDHISWDDPVPQVFFDSSCSCFSSFVTISGEMMRLPLEELKSKLMIIALRARHDLKQWVPELADPTDTADRDFKMSYWAFNPKQPKESKTVAEYIDGKIVFK